MVIFRCNKCGFLHEPDHKITFANEATLSQALKSIAGAAS